MTAGSPRKEAWQAASSGHTTKAQRIGTAVLLLLFAAIAVAVFVITMRGKSVATPFVQSIYIPDYNLLVAHSPYVLQDIQRIREVFAAPGAADGKNQTYHDYAITSGEPLTDQHLQNERRKNFAACQSKDIAIFYIAANGVVDDEGHPGLSSSDGKGVYRLDELLSQIQAISTSTKLVFLDAGQVGEDYLNGNLINEFPFELHQLMAGKSGEENVFQDDLWVINSHGLFQSSRLSHTRRGSVFAVSVADAFAEFRENGDQNESIKLGQLYQNICKRCASMTMEGDRPAQMPLLLRGGHGIVFYNDLVIRDQAMAQSVIYPRQMIPPPLAETVEADAPADSNAEIKSEPPAVAESTADKKVVAEPAPTSEESALARIWSLRDQLQSRQLGSGYSPVDFAPHLWLRINDQIVQFDQLKRVGGVPASDVLDKTENDLRLLANLMKENETSKDSRYQQNLLEPSARLVAEWNQFVSDTPARTTMNPDIAACRDIYFRSRYFLEWTRSSAFRNSLELREEFLALVADLKRIRPLVVASSIQSTELESLGPLVAKLRVHEQAMIRYVSAIVTELNKTGTSASANDVYRIEQILNSLLESPLLSYANPFGFFDAGIETSQPQILSRKSLDKAFGDLLAQNLRPIPTEDSTFLWASDLWIAPGQRNVNNSQNMLKTAQAFLELGSEAPRIDPINNCQLPDRSRSSIQQWNEELLTCLKILRESGAKILTTQAEYSLSIKNSNSRSQPAWPIAILLDQETVYSVAQNEDAMFVSLPPEIKLVAEPMVVEFDVGLGKIDSTRVDLDQPDAKRQFFFTTRNGDPKSINLQLSIDDSGREYANLLEFSIDETGPVELDKPFSFPLVRGANGELLPLNLTIRSSPTNFPQSLRQVDFKLVIIGSDDERVTVPVDEYFPLTVQLPKEDRVDLIVASSSFADYSVLAITSAGSRSYYERHTNLYAFPNRFRNIDFRLENKSGRKKKFRIELFAIARPQSIDKTGVFPGNVVGRAIQDPVAVTRQLESLKRSTIANAPIASSKEFELAPDGWQLIDFRPEPALPVETADPPGNGPSGQVVPQSESLLDLDNGIYARLSENDVEHVSQTITRDFWFDIRPLPSEELVKATATFDPLNELFSVKLVPRWDADVPCPVPGGITCVLETGNSGDYSENIKRQLAKLDDENRNGELQFKISQEEMALHGPFLLYVSINEYRGVFIYKLDETDFRGLVLEKQNLRKDFNFLVLRRITTTSAEHEPVAHWKTGAFWSFTPPEKIVFEVLADMDDGTSDDCQIQLDIKREEWEIPKSQSRLSDRKIEYRARINEENGCLDVQAVVNDHMFDWPPDGTVSGNCTLKGSVVFSENRTNLVTGNTSFEELLRIDGLPPDSRESRWVINGVGQGQFATIKENQKQVQLELASSDLTGTISVQLFVDRDNEPVVSDTDIKLGPAKPNSTGENWQFLFDVETLLTEKKLAIGKNNIYAILVDQLKNETERTKPVGPVTLTIEELTELEKAMIEESKIRKYNLKIQLSRQDSTPVPKPLPAGTRAKIIGSDGKEIQFKSRDNEDGSYLVLDVPVGEYTLVCEYIHTTPTHVKKKMRKEQPLQISVQNEPAPIVLILEEVEEDE